MISGSVYWRLTLELTLCSGSNFVHIVHILETVSTGQTLEGRPIGWCLSY